MLDSHPSKVCSFTYFLAELYLQLLMGPRQRRVAVFAKAITDLLKNLINKPSQETVETVSQTLMVGIKLSPALHFVDC